MDRSGVIVDDVLTRYAIPWADLRQIEVAGGMIFRVQGRRYIRPMMYGGSLAAAVTGYRLQRKVAARMNAVRERLQLSEPTLQSPVSYARSSGLSPWPPLAILALVEAIAAVAVLAK